MKKVILSAAVLLTFIILSEGFLRFVFEEGDLLRPGFIADAELGYRIASYTSGHDELGFRNDGEKETALVAIGDSQTYSIITQRKNSWPEQLSLKLSRPIYNMSLGGYSGEQYAYLTRKATGELGAKWVLWGVFLGDDAALHTANQFQVSETTLKSWLEAKSFLYNWLFYNWPGDIVRNIKMLLLSERERRQVLELCNIHACTSVLAGARNASIDLAKHHVKSGVERLLANILDASQSVRMTVVLIPTKSSVLQAYSAQTINANSNKNSTAWQRSILFERSLNNYIKTQLKRAGIQVIDTLPELQFVASKYPPYFSDYNEHLNTAGQRAIARAIAREVAQ